MQRITITIDDDLLETVDALAARRGYPTRSEAVRDLIRRGTLEAATSGDAASCVAVLSYVYDHETRALSQRLVSAFHAHHHLTVASMHVHLDHESCLEVAVMSGASAAIRGLADDITAQRGVRYANLHLVPSAANVAVHRHGPQKATQTHVRA
jgi:CopG family nickel-responsive transcriptional regulator